MGNSITFVLNRDVFGEDFTLGKLSCGDIKLGFTCEDVDRKMEEGGVKVYGKTAIPRGTYRLTATMSNRFKRIMPQILDVPGFDGVRIHGGNSAEDSLGCVLLGSQRTANGVMGCKAPNERLLQMIQKFESEGKVCWIRIE